MPTRLRFQPGKQHIYQLRTGDHWETIPAVTKLLGQIDKPALIPWAARMAAEYAVDNWDRLAPMPPAERRPLIANAHRASRDKAAAKGTFIHSLAEDLLAGRPVDVPDELLGKVQGLARWIEASDIDVLRTEAMVWTEPDPEMELCGYAGTFDAVVMHPRHGKTLIDWKTGSGVYPETALQLAGYATADNVVIAEEDKPMPRVDTWGVVHIRPDGSDLHLLDTDSARRGAWQRFQALRHLWLTDAPAFRVEPTP